MIRKLQQGKLVLSTLIGLAILWPGTTAHCSTPSAGNTTDWVLAGAGDFCSYGTFPSSFTTALDTNPDLAYQNQTTNQVALWLMKDQLSPVTATQPAGVVVLPAVPASSLRLGAVAAFNSYHQSDLIFQDMSTGAVTIWMMTSVHVSSTVTVAPSGGGSITIPSGNTLFGTADMDNDGVPDLLFQSDPTNSSGSTITVWYMNNSGTTKGTAVVGTMPAQYVVARAAGTVSRKPYIFFQNSSTGALSGWKLTGTTVSSSWSYSTSAPSGYTLSAAGDFNKDGYLDLVLCNMTSGTGSTGKCVFYLNSTMSSVSSSAYLLNTFDANLTAATSGANVNLSWSATNSELSGTGTITYDVWRLSAGSYTKLTSTSQSGTTFTDTAPPSGTNVYTVTDTLTTSGSTTSDYSPHACPAAPAIASLLPSGNVYAMTFDDDFDQDYGRGLAAIDPTKWVSGYSDGASNHGGGDLGWFVPSALSMNTGGLTLSVTGVDATHPTLYDAGLVTSYASASGSPQFSQAGGVFEICAQMPTSSYNINASYWMRGTFGWPPEIDVYEIYPTWANQDSQHLSGLSYVDQTLHYGVNPSPLAITNKATPWVGTSADAASAFHTYDAYWEPPVGSTAGKIRYYVDGVLTYTLNDSDISPYTIPAEAQFLYIMLSPKGSSAPGAHYNVQYARAWVVRS